MAEEAEALKEEGQEGLDTGEQEEAESRHEDPRMAIMERAAEQADRDRMHPEELAEEGLSEKEVIADDEVSGSANEGLGEYADDPLAEFIELAEDGSPMFRTVVNGKVELVPLETARENLQKQMNIGAVQREASARLQQANELLEQAQAKEAEITKRISEIGTRGQDDPELEEMTDEALESKAKEVVSGLFTGTEDEAAAKLAALLKEARGAGKPPTSVDVQELTTQAVAAAREQLTVEQREKDAADGWKEFVDTYPEIAADDDLFRFADGMSEQIGSEHPDWMPSKIMLEAGRRTREWVEKQRTPEQQEPADERKERKRNLRPMPQPRQGVPESEDPESTEDTPEDVLKAMRAARGQPTG